MACFFRIQAWTVQATCRGAVDGASTIACAQNLPPLLVIMFMYTSAIPGVPFVTACVCGWGILGISIFTYVIAWSGEYINCGCPDNQESDRYNVLLQQLVRRPRLRAISTAAAVANCPSCSAVP